MVTEGETETVLAMAARLTVAYLRANPVSADDLHSLIETIHHALCTAASPDEDPVIDPAVPVKKSITREALICLECGKSQQMLKRHLATAHDLSGSDYRTKWSLPADYPMTAPDYAARRSALALKSGLGRKKEEVTATEPVPAAGGKRDHRYPASRWSKSGK
jgi:predicted transcriptional regulator